MLNIKYEILKPRKNCYLFDINSTQDDILDNIALKLSGENVIIQLKQENIATIDFLTICKKVRQLTSHYNSLLIIEDRIDIVQLSNADGVYLAQGTIDIVSAQNLLDKNKIIGTDLTYANFADYVIANKKISNKITYILNSTTSEYKAYREV